MGSEEAARAAPRALRATLGWEGGGGGPRGDRGRGRRPPAASPATLPARWGGRRRGAEDKGTDAQTLQVAREGWAAPRPSPPGCPAVLSGRHPGLERVVGVSEDRGDLASTRSETPSGTRFNLPLHVLLPTRRRERVPGAPGWLSDLEERSGGGVAGPGPGHVKGRGEAEPGKGGKGVLGPAGVPPLSALSSTSCGFF